MTKTSFLDKLSILLEVSKTSKLFIVAIIFLLLLAYIFFTTNKKNIKKNRKIYFTIYAFIILFIILLYHDSLGKMFDYMMDNLFIAVYFPNIAIYLAAIIITNIILCISVFNLKISKIIKNINIIFYCIIHYLLALILSVITTEKLDVFVQTSLYSNENIGALIELSSTIFIVWMIFLIIYKLIRTYQTKNSVEKEKKIIVKEKRKIPSNIKEINSPSYIRTLPTKRTVKTQPTKVSNEFGDILTLEDYRLLLTILNERKEKKRLEEERQKRIEEEQIKYRQLQDLYRSVR